MLVDEVQARIEATIEDLQNRVYQAADFAELVEKGQLPQAPFAAFVLPLGLRPRDQGSAGTGSFVQDIDETVGIVLVVKASGDRAGELALPRIDTLVESLIANLAGWEPNPDTVGVFRLVSGQLLGTGRDQAAIFYQLNLSIQLQVRNIA